MQNRNAKSGRVLTWKKETEGGARGDRERPKNIVKHSSDWRSDHRSYILQHKFFWIYSFQKKWSQIWKKHYSDRDGCQVTRVVRGARTWTPHCKYNISACGHCGSLFHSLLVLYCSAPKIKSDWIESHHFDRSLSFFEVKIRPHNTTEVQNLLSFLGALKGPLSSVERTRRLSNVWVRRFHKYGKENTTSQTAVETKKGFQHWLVFSYIACVEHGTRSRNWLKPMLYGVAGAGRQGINSQYKH